MSNQTAFIFKRVEKKYLFNKEKYNLLLQLMQPYMCEDKYGLHTICNIYYDTDNYELIRTSIDKPCYKEKLRLRSYGIPTKESTVFLEIKKKYKDIVYKRRISLTLEEANRYLKHGMKPNNPNAQILNEIDYFIDFYKPQPKLYLAYDRRAFFGKENENIRITIDHNIRSREYDLSLEKGDYGEYLLNEDNYLMEIKIPESFPLWLSNILSELEIYPSSFSKYGNIYKQNLLNQRSETLCSQAY